MTPSSGGSSSLKGREIPDTAPTDDEIIAALRDGPKSSRELGASVEVLRRLEAEGRVLIDPDRWPDEYVPFNPFIARLPDDQSAWPGWGNWNV